MLTKYIPKQCYKCKHLLSKMSCKAFPERIPQKLHRELVKHDKVIKNQTGNFIYEPKEEFIESDRVQLEKEKKILSLDKSYREKLPKLIFQEIIALKFDWSLLEKAVFKAKLSGSYYVDLEIFPNQKDFQLNRADIGFGSEIFAAFRVIDSAKKIRRKPSYWVHLTVYKDGTYEYNDDYIPEANQKSLS